MDSPQSWSPAALVGFVIPPHTHTHPQQMVFKLKKVNCATAYKGFSSNLHIQLQTMMPNKTTIGYHATQSFANDSQI